MITIAGKYADVSAVASEAMADRGRVGAGAGSGVIGPSRRLPSIPVLPPEQRVAHGQKVQTFGPAVAGAAMAGRPALGRGQLPPTMPRLQILVPKRGVMIRWDEWMWRELREGGYLQRYYEKEKGQAIRRQRAVRRKMGEFKQNYRSDLELRAAIPAREFFRWKAEDKDFWRDDANLRSLKRDNPELCIYGV